MNRWVKFILAVLIIGGVSACGQVPVSLVQPATSTARASYPFHPTATTSTQILVPGEQATWVTLTPTPSTPPTEIAHVRPTLALRTPLSPTNPGIIEPTVPEVRPQEPTRSGPALALPCNLAQPGRPMDITVPDDTRFYPGENFFKTWRLVNAGSCEWTRDYAVVWFSGTNMGINTIQPLNVNVGPGSTIDLTVEMVAPEEPGVYQTNWKLRSHQGELFGIGPNGDAPFWARIIVVPMETPTVTPAPAVDETVVFSGGVLDLAGGQYADLDIGQLDQPETADIMPRVDREDAGGLIAVNGARLVFAGTAAPGREQCTEWIASEGLADLGPIPVGSYVCYSTGDGRVGRLFLASVQLETDQVLVDFMTWAVP